MVTTTGTARSVDDIWLSDPKLWGSDEVDGVFATLRRERPVSFHREQLLPPMPAGPGYWALVRHQDVVRVSRDHETFTSAKGSNIGDLPEPLLEFLGSMVNTDPPKHTQLRSLVNKAFTPSVLAGVEAHVHRRARLIVDAVAPLGRCDFVSDVSVLPLHIICDMMGIPESDRASVFEWTRHIVGGR